MAINFPATAGQPTDGSFTHSEAGIAYFWDGTSWVAEAGNVTSVGGGGVNLTAFSVTTNTAGSAALSYDNTTGVFSYTPPDLSSYVTSTDFSTALANSGNWNTAYGWGDHAAAGYLTSYTVTAADLGTISIDALSDVDTTTTAPTTGQILKYDGTNWIAGNDFSGVVLSAYEVIGLESWTSVHQAPILFTQATDDGLGGGNQYIWLRAYVNDINEIGTNATATLEEVATGGHAAMNQQTADGVTLQTAIRNFVNSTGSLPANPSNATYTITPTGAESGTLGNETYTVDGVSYPVMGTLYVPEYTTVGARDVIVAFHGTLSDDDPDPAVVATQDGIGEQAASFLTNVLTNTNTLNLVDKIIFSVAYPQDHISNVRQYNLSGVGKEDPLFLMGRNLPYARAAVNWAINSLDAFIAAQGGSATIGNVYLLGHSQGGKLVAKVNTLETGITGVVANSPGPIQFDQTCTADPTLDSCAKVAVIHGPAGAAGTYENTDVDNHLNINTASQGDFLAWDGSDYSWIGNIAYNDGAVDAHLNTSNATTGKVLAWNGSDYVWTTPSSGGGIGVLTSQAASGSEVIITGIPTDATEITVMLGQVGLTNTSEHLLVQLGTSSGWITSGYYASSEAENGTYDVSSSSGFPIHNRNSVTSTGNRFTGSMIINLMPTPSAKAYSQIGQFHRWSSLTDGTDVGSSCQSFGNVTGISSSSEITRIRVLANHASGNQTFTTGIIGASYKATAGGGGGSGLLNIADSAQGVNVTGKIATSDGIDIDVGGQITAAGCTVDFGSATISFSGASIGGLQGEISDGVDFHLNKSTANDGEVLKWNATGGGAGTGDYEWVTQPSPGLSSVQQDTNPTLGNDLTLGGFDITGTGNFNITGNITSSGTITDSHGPVRRLGINNQISDYTLQASDAGKVVVFTNNDGTLTVPATGFSAGDVVTLINHTGTDITIASDSGLTLYNTADGTTGNKTAAQRSSSTVVFITSSIAYISGTGLS